MSSSQTGVVHTWSLLSAFMPYTTSGITMSVETA